MGRRLLLALLVAALAGAVAGCHWHYDDEDGECDLIVINDSRCDLRIYVDGWEACLVRDGHVRTVEDVGSGRHVLEALDEDGHVVERRSIELSRGEDYFWRISSC